MPAQASEPTPTNTNPPIAEGVQHGPYKHDGSPYSQSTGLDNAIEDAHNVDAISPEQYQKLGSGVDTLIVKEFVADEDKKLEAELAEEEAATWNDDEPIDAQAEQEALEQEENEDPLEGDVDKYVPPEETSSHVGYPDAHSAEVARRHGDFTG